jgi:hypothetical protein
MKPDESCFEKKHDGTWRLSARAIGTRARISRKPSFDIQCFNLLRVGQRMKPRHLANLPSVVFYIKGDMPYALQSNRILEHPTIESDSSCQLTTRSELLGWRSGRSVALDAAAMVPFERFLRVSAPKTGRKGHKSHSHRLGTTALEHVLVFGASIVTKVTRTFLKRRKWGKSSHPP